MHDPTVGFHLFPYSRVNIQMEVRQLTNTVEEPVFFTIACNGNCARTTAVNYVRKSLLVI